MGLQGLISLRAVDTPAGWEEDNLALAEALRTVTASRDKIMTELERRHAQPNPEKIWPQGK